MADGPTSPEDRIRATVTPAWGTVLRAAGLLVLPVAVALTCLVAAEHVVPWAAAVAIAASLGGVVVMVRRHLRDLEILRQHLDDRGKAQDIETALADRRGVISLIGDTGPAADLALSLERADRQMTAWLDGAHHAAAARARVIQAIPDPLLVVDARSRITSVNTAAVAQFGERIEGRDLSAVIRHPTVLTAVRDALDGKAAREVEFEVAAPMERTFTVQIEALAGDGAQPPAALLLFVDLTAIRRAEQMRVDFVANVSHELRTPLATLMGFIETLQGPARDDTEARDRFLEIMRGQAHRMSRLVNDLLSLSRIETNEHTRPTRSVDLVPLLDGVKATLDLEARRKDMRVRINAPAGLPPVIGESDELTQVLQNLMDNAIKYGRGGTVVEVSATLADRVPAAYPGRREGAVAVSVRDQGDGIDSAHIPRLTERFYRVDTARSRELGGTGLGLAIVKHIVSRHRGALTIDSERGVGTTVTIYLPSGRVDASPGGGELNGTERGDDHPGSQTVTAA